MRLFTVSNFITLGNLLFGCLGILAVVGDYDLKKGGFCIAIALLLDFCDGFVARLLKESSELGKQLDSLADVVSFGVLPGVMMLQLLSQHHELSSYIPYLGLIIPLFSALRLAKFNIDTRQAYGFIGLPTPANAIVIASFPFLTHVEWITQSPFLIAYTILFSFLLISELPLPALKFKNFTWADNKFSFLFIAISIIAVLSLKALALPLLIFGYIAYALYLKFFRKN